MITCDAGQKAQHEIAMIEDTIVTADKGVAYIP
jgi:hypothetical protein